MKSLHLGAGAEVHCSDFELYLSGGTQTAGGIKKQPKNVPSFKYHRENNQFFSLYTSVNRDADVSLGAFCVSGNDCYRDYESLAVNISCAPTSPWLT